MGNTHDHEQDEAIWMERATANAPAFAKAETEFFKAMDRCEKTTALAAREFVRHVLQDIFKQPTTEQQIEEVARKVERAVLPWGSSGEDSKGDEGRKMRRGA